MIHRGTYDGTIYYNPANKFCIISVKTAEKDVPEEARSIRRRKDHLIRFVATGYELPRTDAVELELDGEWKKGKYGMQLQVEQWHEIVPQTKSGVEGYLASGLIKGIGPALAKQIVSRFGVETLDILQNRPERLLEIKGITENKLEAIKTSYAESRMLQDLMTLLSPFKITPKTAQKIYQFFGPASVDILKKSPFELCQISGFGFLRVDAIVQKNGGDLRAPMRIKGALFWALEDSKGKNGHLFLTSEALQKEALQLLNAKIPIPSLRLHAQEVSDVLEDMILHGEVVSVKGDIYLPRVFAQECGGASCSGEDRTNFGAGQTRNWIGAVLKTGSGCVCNLSPQSFHHHRLPGHRQDNRAENNFGGLPPPASPGRDRLDGADRPSQPAYGGKHRG